MSLLPQQIIPQQIPFGKVLQDSDGVVLIEKDWWLLLYNLCQNTIGTGGTGTGTAAGLPASALTELAAADADAVDADAVSLRATLANLANLDTGDADAPSADARNALILAQDNLLPDAGAAAQPAVTITPTGSVFTYTAPFVGQVSVTAGTVSLIQIVRQGTTVATGLTTGLFPMSRGDQLKVTYTGAPTMVFLPT